MHPVPLTAHALAARPVFDRDAGASRFPGHRVDVDRRLLGSASGATAHRSLASPGRVA